MSIAWEIIKEKGNEEFRKKNYNTAVNLYTEALKLNSNEESLYANRSLCYKYLSKYKLSLYDLNKALEINPRNIKYLKRLSQIHVLYGNLGESLNIMNKCINLEPRNPEHKNELDTIQKKIYDYELLDENIDKKDFVKAEQLADKLLKDCTEWIALKIKYIQILLQNIKLNEAIKYILNSIKADEKNDEVEYYLALAFYYDGQYDKAKQIVNNKIKYIKDDHKLNHLNKLLKEIEPLKEKANELFKNGNYKDAIEKYTDLVNFDADNKKFKSLIYANRSLAFQKLNNNMEALKDINQSIALNDAYTKAYLRRGSIYMSLNMFEEARYDFQKVKEREPYNQDAIKSLEQAKKEEKIAKKRDYYKILGLEKTANENDIRKAYKKLAIKWHPDKNNQSEESKKLAEKTFRDINDAFTVLSDTKKKQMYDSGIDPNNPEEANGMDGMNFGGDFGGGAGINIDDIFRMFSGGGSSFGGNNDFGGFPFGGGFSFGGNSGNSRRQQGNNKSSGGQKFSYKFK